MTNEHDRCPECGFQLHFHAPSNMLRCDRCDLLVPREFAATNSNAEGADKPATEHSSEHADETSSVASAKMTPDVGAPAEGTREGVPTAPGQWYRARRVAGGPWACMFIGTNSEGQLVAITPSGALVPVERVAEWGGNVEQQAARVAELEAQLDLAKDAVEAALRLTPERILAIARERGQVACAYCGNMIEATSATHWLECEKHPSRKEIAALAGRRVVPPLDESRPPMLVDAGGVWRGDSDSWAAAHDPMLQSVYAWRDESMRDHGKRALTTVPFCAMVDAVDTFRRSAVEAATRELVAENARLRESLEPAFAATAGVEKLRRDLASASTSRDEATALLIELVSFTADVWDGCIEDNEGKWPALREKIRTWVADDNARRAPPAEVKVIVATAVHHLCEHCEVETATCCGADECTGASTMLCRTCCAATDGHQECQPR